MSMNAAEPNTIASLRATLAEGLTELGLKLGEAQQETLLRYILLLEKWNKTYNLTAVREPDRMLGLHILDSLAILPHLGDARTLLDVGTGAGLPGIPMAIAAPALHVTMLDAIAKKTTFVRQAIGELALTNADVATARVEQFVPTRKFDVVVSRAFAELKDFIDGAGHLCADTGTLLAMKGVYPHDEIARLPAGFVVERSLSLHVPQIDGQRHLLIIKKKA